jgi:hypothetical protein
MTTATERIAMDNHPSFWDGARALGEFIGGVGTAFGAIFAAVKLFPMMWDRALLLTKCNSAETAAREYRLACDRLERTVSMQHQTIELLEQSNAKQRHEYELQEERFSEFASSAGSFIITLVNALKDQRTRLQNAGIIDMPTIPPIPEDLEQAVAAAKRKTIEQRRAREAPKSEHPFTSTTAPEGGRIIVEDRQLTEHFSLAELTTTSTGLDNTPDADQEARLQTLAEFMEKVRAILGNNAVTVDSAFRSEAVNAAVGGVSNSAHALA